MLPSMAAAASIAAAISLKPPSSGGTAAAEMTAPRIATARSASPDPAAAAASHLLGRTSSSLDPAAVPCLMSRGSSYLDASVLGASGGGLRRDSVSSASVASNNGGEGEVWDIKSERVGIGLGGCSRTRCQQLHSPPITVRWGKWCV